MIDLTGEDLTLEQVTAVAREQAPVAELAPAIVERMQASRNWVEDTLAADSQTIYGLNTGFGPLAQVRITPEQTAQLSRNLILSSVVGVGPPLSPDLVRAMMLIRINTFANGVSGVRPVLADTLRLMLNRGVIPDVPSKGSLGASGDLAPLAHLAAVLVLGDPDGFSGQAWFEGELLDGAEAMRRAGIDRLVIEAKEGLGLTNGTSMMLAAACLGVVDAESLVRHAEIAAALSLEGLLAKSSAFDARLHAASRQPGQIHTAANLRALLDGSRLIDSRPDRVQDAYSLRCTPQVVGPVRDMLSHLRERTTAAINGVNDNPLIFVDDGEGAAISGGNFHGQAPAMWLDTLAIATSYLGSISERRTFRMTSPDLSEGLPSMLVPEPGLESGLMMPQYTAAALVSDNKTLAHPDSVDSIPSSASQEDHVSMGANAARHALEVIDNVRVILAVELLTAAQAIDLRHAGPGALGVGTAAAHALVRERVRSLEGDRALTPDIESLVELIRSGALIRATVAATGREL